MDDLLRIHLNSSKRMCDDVEERLLFSDTTEEECVIDSRIKQETFSRVVLPSIH